MKSILMRGLPVAEVEFRVLSSVHPTNANIESEALSADYLKKYYLI